METKNHVTVVAPSEFITYKLPKNHPENPNRMEGVKKAIQLITGFIPHTRVMPRNGTTDQVALVHSMDYISHVLEITKEGYIGITDSANELPNGLTNTVYVSPAIIQAAMQSVGSVITAMEWVFEGKAKRVFCATRCAGHLALHNMGQRYCLFNNIAIAARYAQQMYGVKDVMIIDFDINRGVGTEKIFKGDDFVSYFQTRKEDKDFQTDRKPGVKDQLSITIDKGSEYVNIEHIYDNLLELALNASKPELILVSAGYNLHRDDPECPWNVGDEAIDCITRNICQKAKCIPLVFVLEGGQRESILKKGIEKTLFNMYHI